MEESGGEVAGVAEETAEDMSPLEEEGVEEEEAVAGEEEEKPLTMKLSTLSPSVGESPHYSSDYHR